MKPRGESRGHLEPRLAGRARRPRRAGISAHRDGSPYPNPKHRGQSYNLIFFHAMEKSFPHCGKLPHLTAVRRTWMQRISFGFGRGCCAEITGRFSDGGASRTTRAGLVSARDRPRSVHAEKMPVGFRAAQIQKKSSLPSLRPTCHPHHSTFPPFHFFNIPSFHS